MTIVEFLEARLTEDEGEAQAADEGRLLTWSKNDHMVINDSGFMQAFTPSRILREVAAKRKLIQLAISDHYRSKVMSDPRAFDCNHWSEKQEKWVSHGDPYADCETLHLLVLTYSDHPDFNPDWTT